MLHTSGWVLSFLECATAKPRSRLAFFLDFRLRYGQQLPGTLVPHDFCSQAHSTKCANADGLRSSTAMRLSPLELRKHQFAKKLRFSGYDADEVNGFIRQMADQWAEVLEDNRRLEDRAKELEGKLTHYEKVELALQEALETARHTARQVEDNAERKANLTIEGAELRAQQMLQDAEQERYSIKQDLVKLNSRQTEIAARMRAFLMAEMEVLAQYQGDDPIGFIRLVSAEDSGPAGILPERVSQLAPSDSTANPDDVLEVVEDEPVEDEPVEDTQSDLTEEPTPGSDEPVAVDDPASIVEPEPIDEPSVSSDRVLDDAVDVPLEEAMPYPSPAVPPPPPPVSATPPAIPPPIIERPPLPPRSPAPVEEPVVLAPNPEPTGLPSVEELLAQKPPPPPPPKPEVDADDVDSRPTYRDMLSGSQPSSAEATESPFSSSFFKSPFAKDKKPDESESHTEPVSEGGKGQSWSLRSLVTGDGDSEPTTSSPSEAERERIRRILEDLD